MGKNNFSPWKYLGLISQLAISMLTPILLMVVVCMWLKNKYAMGDWIILVGLLLGVASGFNSVWVYMKRFLDEGRRQQQEYEDKFR
ncbi:MAG: AtpZ/AtpI family protein [Oscillospiraceae bacterium]|nr:AtpZ/AtpI family protein [Oscillospiraceae bacterium]